MQVHHLTRDWVRVMLVIMFSVKVFCKPTMCTENQYKEVSPSGFTRCVDCPRCPEGLGPSVQCGTNITPATKIECLICVKGFNFSSDNDFEQCQSCSFCSKDEVTTPCTSMRNTKCDKKCISKGNYFEHSSDDCQLCSWCCGDQHDTVKDECLKKGMPRQQSCTVHRKKECTPPTTPTAENPTAENPTANFTATHKPIRTSTIKRMITTVLTPVKEQHTFHAFIDQKILVGCFSGAIGLIAVVLIIALVIKKRKCLKNGTQASEQPIVIYQHENGGEARYQATPLDHTTPLMKAQGRTLVELKKSDYTRYEKVCDKLDSKKSYLKIARQYKMDEDKVTKIEEQPGDTPTKDILSYIEGAFPNLLISEFAIYVENIGRRDVGQFLREIDSSC